jgi:hypothetical protein
MIISASRRTDIPAFYAQWFMNRVRAGYCTVPNPFNPSQVTTISLRPEDVDVIVFWTRNPRPMFRHLEELDRRGYRYYFQYTLLDNPRLLDRKGPPVVASLDTFRELAGRIGPERVIWRYDPIVFSNLTDTRFHQETYARIARALRGHTYRSVISLLDMYRKLDKRLRALAGQGVEVVDYDGKPDQRFDELMHNLVDTAHENGMQLLSCAETRDLQVYGIRPGKCIDDDYIRDVFGLEVSHRKDPSQREACGCVVSRDIGMYETCLFGCQYCYATGSFERARLNYRAHDPHSPSLLGWYDAPPASQRRLG